MPHGIASAKQLAMMERVLDAYCQTFGVTDGLEREALAAQVLHLFDQGIREEETLLAALIGQRSGQ